MATVVSTPVMVWQATLLAATGLVQSSVVTTVALNLTGAWEATIQVQAQMSGVSNDPVVHVYSSQDGGTTYDLQPMMSIAIPMQTTGSRIGRVSARIPQGQYILQIVASGPSSQTITIPTYTLITSVINV